MKRILFLSALFLVSISSFSAEKSTIIQSILNEYVIQKVETIQEFIRFSDLQADQLKQTELNYLLEVQKAENCNCCRSLKRVDKLTNKRNLELQKILTREQYMKYDTLWKDRIKKHPLRAPQK